MTDRLRAIVEQLPPGAAVTLPVEAVASWLEDEPTEPELPEPAVVTPIPLSWRERLWTLPDGARLNVKELAEALDRSPDWVYRAVNAKRAASKGREPIPCSRLDGELVFEAGAIRRWLDRSQEVVNPDRRLRAS